MDEKYNLTIYGDRSILVAEDGAKYEFLEGTQSEKAQNRYANIRKVLEKGYFENVIKESIRPDVTIEELDEEHLNALKKLVNSVTSEVGRAIIGLTAMQLTLKSIDANQSIRLHKGSKSSSSFSWKEGIPMRVLDKNYITPMLRKYGLLKLNADGFMMTRTLAENYPYSRLYKAAIRGAKDEWMNITEWIETDKLNPLFALKHFVALLFNKTEQFNSLSKETIEYLKEYLSKDFDVDVIKALIIDYIEKSTYSARLFEISIHSFFQAIDEMKYLGEYLKPLSQMRSANKKHGNIGDIELTSKEGTLSIVEAWDAKYGKIYFRDELEELGDKLALHPEAEIVGFISDKEPTMKKEITDRIDELSGIFDVQIKVLSFEDWIDFQIESYLEEEEVKEFYNKWLIAITESICQMRREYAPIDEPTFEWVKEFNLILKSKLS